MPENYATKSRFYGSTFSLEHRRAAPLPAGFAQLFCVEDCRLAFHKERLQRQRTGLYAGQLPEPATPEATSLFEQAEHLPLDQRRHLIERLLATTPPEKPETEPSLPLELASTAPKN
jgi:hypothetical protein